MNLATRLSIIIILLVSSFVFYLLAFHYVRIGGMLSAITFWSAVWLMIPKRFFNMVWGEIKKGRAYWISASIYMTFHVLLYGAFYEALFGGVEYLPYVTVYFGAAVPPPLPYFIEYETEAIGFTFYLYGFVSDAIPYTIFLGLILSLLLGANVERVLELWKTVKAKKKSITLVVLPTVGIISGTSCCLSLPTLIIVTIAAGIGAVFSVLPILASPTYYILVYYILPLGSVALLTVNLRDLNRVLKCRFNRNWEIKSETKR